jgi:citrate lyase beta subunit
VLAAREPGSRSSTASTTTSRTPRASPPSAPRVATWASTARPSSTPGQVEVCNDTFAPSPEAVEEAEGILEAWEAGAGKGVVTYNGKMIENLHVDIARRVLDTHRAISGVLGMQRRAAGGSSC